MDLSTPLGEDCSSLDGCKDKLEWSDGTKLAGDSFFTGSFGSLENSDSSMWACLLVGHACQTCFMSWTVYSTQLFQIDATGVIKTPEDGCIAGLAKSLCQYECPGITTRFLHFLKILMLGYKDIKVVEEWKELKCHT